jgi:hypothetical protein
MTTTQALLSCALVLAAFAPARAADTRFLVSGGLVVNQGNTVDLTGKTTGGYTAEVGALFDLPGFGPGLVVYAGYAHMPAEEGTADRPTFALSGTRVGLDLVFGPWAGVPLTLSTGPSVHVWKGTQRGGDPSLYPADNHLKAGWRVGAGYALTKNWSATLNYTFTEWRSNADTDVTVTNPSRPAYFSLMATYRF